MRFPSGRLRILIAALTGAGVLAAGCGDGGRSSVPDPTPSAGTATATPTASPSIPDTPVGEQLRWYLGVVERGAIPQEEYEDHFTDEFLQKVPLGQFNAINRGLAGMRLTGLRAAGKNGLEGTIVVSGQTFTLRISVTDAGKINGLLVTPGAPDRPTAPASWAELDRRLREIAPRVGFLAAEVTPRGECRTVHAIEPGGPRPLGSMFKLYLLGAVAEAIGEGKLDWDSRLTIEPELKSLPSGELQNRPDGSEVTVAEAAKLMISISDNTGTDLLLHRVGRRALQERLPDVPGNAPALTTRELFVLKGVNHPRLAEKYLSLNAKDKLAYLRDTVAKTPLSRFILWQEPRRIDTLEWFASPRDICHVFADLARLADRPGLAWIDEIMSVNDGGLDLDEEIWPTVWFKGGSEPGVFDLGYLARTSDGKTYVVTALTSDPERVIDEGTATGELLALIRGAFALVPHG